MGASFLMSGKRTELVCGVVSSLKEFRGADYSWGDKKISDLANGIIDSTGNLTNWVSYTYNHHMTFIIKEI